MGLVNYDVILEMLKYMQKIGEIGEDIAELFLVKQGYKIIERNYLKKFGEIDLICTKDRKVHFIEVKTVSRETIATGTVDQYRPEDNIHVSKLRRIGRTIEAYIHENNVEEDWEFHAILIELSRKNKTAKVRQMKNLIIELNAR